VIFSIRIKGNIGGDVAIIVCRAVRDKDSVFKIIIL